MAKGCKARTSVKKKEHAGKLCHIYIDNVLKRLLVAGRNKNGGRPDKNGRDRMAMAEISHSCGDYGVWYGSSRGQCRGPARYGDQSWPLELSIAGWCPGLAP